MKFHDGQYQFKVPFVMYTGFEAILKTIEAPKPTGFFRFLKAPLVKTFATRNNADFRICRIPFDVMS